MGILISSRSNSVTIKRGCLFEVRRGSPQANCLHLFLSPHLSLHFYSSSILHLLLVSTRLSTLLLHCLSPYLLLEVSLHSDYPRRRVDNPTEWLPPVSAFCPTQHKNIALAAPHRFSNSLEGLYMALVFKFTTFPPHWCVLSTPQPIFFSLFH